MKNQRNVFERFTSNHSQILPACAIVLFSIFTYANIVRAQDAGDEEEKAYYQANHFVPIQGEQDNDYAKGVYLVTNDVVIPKGKTMTLMPGTTVLLKKDTRITVQGRLICQGAPEDMITFARLANDKYFIPIEKGIDARWDGIFMAESASIELRFSQISGSKYGVETGVKNGTVLLDTVLFKDNKLQNLKIAGSVVSVPENQFVACSPLAGILKKPSLKKIDKKSIPAFAALEPKKPFDWIIPVRIGLGAVALGGGVMYLVNAMDINKYETNIKNIDPKLSTDEQYPIVNEWRSKSDKAKPNAEIGEVIGIMGAISFAVTFLF